MQRYFVFGQAQQEGIVAISGDDAHHIARVMRMKPGDGIICVFPDGRAAVCEIQQIANEHVQARIVQWKEERSELPVRIYIAQGLPKGEKWELVIQKGTELGAAGFLPFEAARSVVKWDAKKAEKKVDRWKKSPKKRLSRLNERWCRTCGRRFHLSNSSPLAKRSMFGCLPTKKRRETPGMPRFRRFFPASVRAARCWLSSGRKAGSARKKQNSFGSTAFRRAALGRAFCGPKQLRSICFPPPLMNGSCARRTAKRSALSEQHWLFLIKVRSR
ncbi:RNA methyltransferase, RsmE family protein [Geobacillus kaustophilus]|uniref:Ribosomal RNA small subunit methyltransferase E n=1 Tax=Geobacillus kaustophilus TaxID=1462 RepID=A0A0D8BTT6_GEOKU|nr:RNA methyltransferase, RsmE family protein [Geobacillus kaustophilus]